MIYEARSDDRILGGLTYYIPHTNGTLDVTFYLPFETNSSQMQTSFNVQLNSGSEEASCEKFLIGYFSNPFESDIFFQKDLSKGLKFEGILAATSDTDVLTILVHPVKKK